MEITKIISMDKDFENEIDKIFEVLTILEESNKLEWSEKSTWHGKSNDRYLTSRSFTTNGFSPPIYLPISVDIDIYRYNNSLDKEKTSVRFSFPQIGFGVNKQLVHFSNLYGTTSDSITLKYGDCIEVNNFIDVLFQNKMIDDFDNKINNNKQHDIRIFKSAFDDILKHDLCKDIRRDKKLKEII